MPHHQSHPCFQKLVTEADIEVVGSAKPQNITFKDSGRIVETQLKQSFQVIFYWDAGLVFGFWHFSLSPCFVDILVVPRGLY